MRGWGALARWAPFFDDQGVTPPVSWQPQPGTAGQAPTSGALSLITRKVAVGGEASFDFTNIPQTFEELELHLMMACNQNVAENANLTINGDGAAHYDLQFVTGVGSGVTGAIQHGNTGAFIGWFAANNIAGAVDVSKVLIQGYARAVFQKLIMSEAVLQVAANGIGNDLEIISCGNLWYSTAAVTELTVTPAAGTVLAGSVASLYGRS